MNERCITGEPEARVGKAELYAAYAAYCDDHEVELKTSEVFARELYKAAPGVRKMRGQEGDNRTQEYCGIRLVASCPPDFKVSPEPEPWREPWE